MKKNSLKLVLHISLITFLVISCKEQVSNTKTENKISKVEVEKETITPITIEKLQSSPAYTDAVLQMNIPRTSTITEGNDVNFSFTIDNYELGVQTTGPNSKILANSGKGQHIHFILNNEPYSAHYESAFAKAIPDGTHHLVAFLSRSYHESVKNDKSVVVQKLEVGAKTENSRDLDINAPTLIYSRPKGEYTGKDTENLLLDFFVLNTTLSQNGNKVRATINGNEFLIAEWAPHIIKGLSKGIVTIKLELIDAQGTSIDGPFNSVTRTVTLK